MNEIRLNELLNKIYYEYLDSHEAEEFIIYFKRLKQDKENLQSKIDKAIEYIDKHFQDDEGIICKITGEYEAEINEKFIKELLDILKEDK